MELESAWLRRTDWRHRSSAFRELREENDRNGEAIVVMEYTPRDAADEAVWSPTRELWRHLPRDRNVIESIAHLPAAPLLLRYAAIDWRWTFSDGDGPVQAAARVAQWGIELTRVYEMIAACVPEAGRGWLACPRMYFDLLGEPRLVFLPATRKRRRRDVPREVAASWPRADERALTWIIGHVLARDILASRRIAEPLRSIVSRCAATKPEARFQGLRELRRALMGCVSELRDRYVTSSHARHRMELGIGLLWLDQPERALPQLENAIREDPAAPLPLQAYRAARAIAGLATDDTYGALHRHAVRMQSLPDFHMKKTVGPAPNAKPEPRREIAWSEAAATGAKLEASRDFEGAVALYYIVSRASAPGGELDRALARCHLQLGRASHALEHADRALAIEPNGLEALDIRTRALLLAKRHDDALAAADAWCAHAPNNAHAWHVRGRCLLALGRPLVAGESLARACELDPNLLVAQLLRREVERTIQQSARTAGHARIDELDVPEHLTEVRAALARTAYGEAIEILRRPEHRADPAARLVLAGCLLFERSCEEAAAIYEAVATSPELRPAALMGRARALLELGRDDDALAIADVASAEHPDDAQAAELRAQILERLGRTEEAESELRRCFALVGSRSDLRVRSLPPPTTSGSALDR